MGYSELSFNEDKIFLVTGGAGFIGSNLIEAILNLGARVRCLDNFSTGSMKNIENFLQNNRFELIEGSICDLEICEKAIRGAEFVLHQAAWGSIPRSIEMPLEYDEINVHGTLNMLHVAMQNGIRKFVYASSSSVYGDDNAIPKVEGREGRLLAPYPITKAVNELYAKNYSDLYGLPTVGLRYFNVFGKRQDPFSTYAAVIPIFVKSLLEGKSPTINGDGSISRDFTYIENVIEANLKACLSDEKANGEVFNVAYGKSATLNVLFENIRALLHVNIDPIFGPMRKGDVLHSLADISKARNLLGYSPDYSLEDGLNHTIEWYKQNL